MRLFRVMTVLFFSVLVTTPMAREEKWPDVISKYSCLEVEKFMVDRDDTSTKELARAAEIPEESLIELQEALFLELSGRDILSTVVKAGGEGCEGPALLFGGKVTDFKAGSRAKRYWVGFGAGKQKFQVDSYLKDRETGASQAERRIIDRKSGGWFGGSEKKGLKDFTEKVVKFIKTGK